MLSIIPDTHWILWNIGLKGSVILLFGLILGRSLQHVSAAWQHLLMLSAIGIATLVPILSIVVPHWKILTMPSSTELAIVAPHTADTRLAELPPNPASEVVSRTPITASPTQRDDHLLSANSPTAAVVATWLTNFWAAGAILVIGRLSISWIVLWRLSSGSRTVDEGDLLTLAEDLKGRLGVKRPIQWITSTRRTIPMTWGIIKPCILLPAEARHWPLRQQTSVLLHEMGHIRRQDSLAQCLVVVASAIHWFNPLIWICGRRIALMRERACDDLVLSHQVSASDYAQTLLDTLTSPLRPAPGIGLPMIGQHQLAARMASILDPCVSRAILSRRAITACLLLGVLLAYPLAALHGATDDLAREPSNTEPGDPGNGFDTLVTGELVLSGNEASARVRFDNGKLLPALSGDVLAESWDPANGSQMQLTRRDGRLALAFYNVGAKQARSSWNSMSPVRVWGFLGGSFRFFRGERFPIHTLAADNKPRLYILDGGGKLEVVRRKTDTGQDTIGFRYAFLRRNGDVIVANGIALDQQFSLPWGDPIEGLVAGHRIVKPSKVFDLGKPISVRHYVQNQSESTISFQYYPRGYALLHQYFADKARWHSANNVSRMGRAPYYQITLKPGQAWDFRHPGESYETEPYSFTPCAPGQRAKRLTRAQPQAAPGANQFRFTLMLRHVTRDGEPRGHHQIATAASTVKLKQPNP